MKRFFRKSALGVAAVSGALTFGMVRYLTGDERVTGIAVALGAFTASVSYAFWTWLTWEDA